MSARAINAASLDLASCHACGLLSRLGAGHPHAAARCPRCGAGLHLRRPDSIARAWALLIAAMIFYVPANVLPILQTTTLGQTKGDTIIGGVIYFIRGGDWPLALVIFTASVIVPVAKIVALGYLLVSVQRRSSKRATERTRLYRIIEIVGPWSMVDVYVVTILVALVHVQSLANIEPGPAALYFCAVVVITMFAAMAFDPRLIWDVGRQGDGRAEH